MNVSVDNSRFSSLNHSWVVVLLSVILIAGVAATGYRIYTQYSVPSAEVDRTTGGGHLDFHNGAYRTSLAFREGINPYWYEWNGVWRASPICSPIVFILHLPFTFVDLHQSDVLFFVYNTAMFGLLAWMGIRMSNQQFRWGVWILLFAILIYSRPGHVTLFTGYFTAELVIGSVIALHFATTRPALAGAGMLLASIKPTYVLPLIVMMLCRRNYRAVAVGLGLCIAGGLIGLGWLASFSSLGEVLAGINEGRLAFHEDASEDPINTWTRLDSVGVVSKFAGWKPDDLIYFLSMLGMMAVPGWLVYRVSQHEQNRGATGMTATIACLTILVSVYHHAYDALLIAVPWIGIAFFQTIDRAEMPKPCQQAIAVLLAIPLANYFSTLLFQEKMGLDPRGGTWEVITALNGVSLLLALIIACWCAWNCSKRRIAESDPNKESEADMSICVV